MILLRRGRAKLNGIRKNNHFKELNRIDGMPMEFEWTINPRIMTLGLLEKIQSLMRDFQCKPEDFTDRIASIEVQIPSLYQDHTVSWVRIVNGIDTYVTESMLTAKKEDIASEKPIAKARPRQKTTAMLTSVSIPATIA